MSVRDKASQCPQCDQPASGNFCQNCGSPLGGRFCNSCGEKVSPGAGFCNKCGTKVAGSGEGKGGGNEHRAAAAAALGGQNLPWWIAGAAMFALILFLGTSMVRPVGPAAPTGAPAGTAAGSGTPPDISQMSPIAAADALFNRVMNSISSNDSAQAQAFMPMAIAAYQRARPLSLDGLFHLSMLNRTAMNLEAALDNALEIIEQNPSHLLGLAAAAEAALELGLADEAGVHYQRIFNVYDDERNRGLDEYDQHSQIVAVLKEDAEAFLAGR
jgi:tetratricopeptide (TPR) repeat protein